MTAGIGRDIEMRNPLIAINGRLARYRKDISGVASIEMAFIFPVMVLVYFGLVDATNVLSANRRVTLTASTLADLVTQAPGTIVKNDIGDFFEASSAIMEPFNSSSISLEIYEYKLDGSNNPVLSWTHKNATANCGAAPTVDAQMKQLMTEGNDIVIARVCYTYNWVIGKIFGSAPMTLKDQLVLRPRQATSIDCTDCV
jgi:Flp pilus assembly protein TadG